MDVNQTNTIAQTHPDGHQQNRARHRDAGGQIKDGDKDPPSGSWREQEAVEFDHHLIDALTPEVQGLIDSLRREIEPMRAQLASAEKRIDDLNAVISQHVFLKIPNRHEIVRELEHILNPKTGLTLAPILALLHVANADQTRRQFGRKALDCYLQIICERISQGIRQTDSFGNIGGNDFALILFGLEEPQARVQLHALIADITQTPVIVAGQSLQVQLTVGAVNLGDVSSVEMAIRLADQNMDGKSIS